ncbi:MAG: RluA family pseudouridine synthase [Chloroflexota bacterium]
MTSPAILVCSTPGERLDSYLAQLLGDLSRSHIQRLIREGHVLVNGQTARPSTRLALGDQVQLHLPDAPSQELVPEAMPLSIVYQDDQVVVVDKPAGLTVHPGPGHSQGTLVNALLAHYPDLKEVGDPMRPGLVHRLDADTSGLMVVARTPLAYESLSRQMRNRTVTKVYLALVRGHPKPQEGVIEAPIARHPRDRQRMGIVAEGRQATTHYLTIKLFNGFALLEVRPHTGRTHQIRVHMAALGHPVAGDAKYGGRVPFLRRQFLHACRLGFDLPPAAARVEFTSALPPDLEGALATLEPSP